MSALADELTTDIRRRHPIVRHVGEVRIEGTSIEVLSYAVSDFDFGGDLAGVVRTSARNLHDRYMSRSPALAAFPDTRPAQPYRARVRRC